MIRPCPNVSPCQSTDDPFSNLSSEAVDTLDFIDTRFQGTDPTLQKNWTSTSCGFTYSSSISALDAEMQALAGAILCELLNNPGGPPVFNTPQTCCVPTFGFTQHCWTVPGGTIAGPNLGTANQRAQALACQLAGQVANVQLTDIPLVICQGQRYSTTINITGDNQPYVYMVDNSTLPPGITATGGPNNTLTLAGIPTTLGNFTFTITAESPEGFFINRTYTIAVLGLTSGSPGQGTAGLPYSFQFVGGGGAGGPYTFTSFAPPPPPGLSISFSGLLSGTPQQVGSFTFGVGITDRLGNTCGTQVTMTVIGVCNGFLHGVASCPGNPGLIASISIQAGTYCLPPGTPQAQVDALASTALNNMLTASLTAQGCTCPGPTVSGTTVTGDTCGEFYHVYLGTPIPPNYIKDIFVNNLTPYNPQNDFGPGAGLVTLTPFNNPYAVISLFIP